MSPPRHLLRGRVAPPVGRPTPLSSSTCAEGSVYHLPSCLGANVSSTGARPLLLASPGTFFFPLICLISVFAPSCPEPLLIRRRWKKQGKSDIFPDKTRPPGSDEPPTGANLAETCSHNEENHRCDRSYFCSHASR